MIEKRQGPAMSGELLCGAVGVYDLTNLCLNKASGQLSEKLTKAAVV